MTKFRIIVTSAPLQRTGVLGILKALNESSAVCELIREGSKMSDVKHPEAHVNEEPRNDLFDIAISMIVTSAFFFIVSVVATIASV
jgi:hypothetical protein